MRKSHSQIFCFLLASVFLLGSHKGYLALWKDEGTEPFQIFPVKVESLPQADQERLSDGIEARSDLELSSLLEDFLS
jgi:hypothetical protein